MTHLLFQDALMNCYASEMGKYYLKNYIHFTILLIVGNVPRNTPVICNLYSNTRVVFLHPNTISFIKLMDRGVIAAFQAYYLKRTFAQAIAATEEDTDTIMEGLQHL